MLSFIGLGILTVDHPAFRTAVAEVGTAAAQLRTDRDAVARHVDALLDGGWSGPAATAYAEAWREWCAGAEQVLDGLVTMARLLDAVHLDLTERDLGAGSGLGRLAARLG
ncbi:WXG100 family type VII secretion target [Nocardioides sp. URHA0020]|uniref:WXG100 family type VII secretion target n=1 Tax=Nocardioides sp. URHA0020 TaxID=1380392 RepID=UPI000566F169|nr:WXG100 family type VII secretion target [Nocardioides sp. URHA0020]